MMTWPQFLEWKVYVELEPFEDERADFNAAHIVQAIIRDGRRLGEYLLPFGDAAPPTPWVPAQTVEYQEQMIDAWIVGSNAVLAAKGNR
jgi:hypothetical protein